MKIEFENILKKIEPVKDKVFILPIDREYLLKLSEKTNVEFPELYIDFRRKIGFTQDLLIDLVQTADSLIDDLDYTEAWCKDFFPIGTFSTEETDYTWLIKKDSNNGIIYQVDNEEEENAKPEKTKFTLQSLIEEEIENIKNDNSYRLNNIDKVRLFEFRIETEEFDAIVEVLNKRFETEWVNDNWRNKYTPNVLGIEVAFIKLDENQIMLQREKDIIDGGLAYFFEIEEPLDTIKNNSIGDIIIELFEEEGIKYDFTDYGIMDNDSDE
ncbi:MAG: hypothetical protein GY756_20780 [bacterium]|nr:hypothetical protein [bacterium]